MKPEGPATEEDGPGLLGQAEGKVLSKQGSPEGKGSAV